MIESTQSSIPSGDSKDSSRSKESDGVRERNPLTKPTVIKKLSNRYEQRLTQMIESTRSSIPSGDSKGSSLSEESDTDLRKRNPSSKPTVIEKEREELTNKSSSSIITKICSIFSWLFWLFGITVTIVVLIVGTLVYSGKTEVVRSYVCSLQYTSTYISCPIDPLEPISIPPLSEYAEKSASLAETLINTDVSIPMRCVQAKTSLIEIQAKVAASDIEVNIRRELLAEMQQLDYRIQRGADDLTDVLSMFSGAVDRLKMYIKWGLNDLYKLNNSLVKNQNGLVMISSSAMEQINRLNSSFQSYMEMMDQEVNGVLTKTQQAHLALNQITEKMKTIQRVNFKGMAIDQNQLDILEVDSFWSRLFGKDEPSIRKHQSNIQTLNGFVDFITNASDNIGEIILKLQTFKGRATSLKRTTAFLTEVPVESINEQIGSLQAAQDRLTQSKESFERKIERENRN